MWKGAQDFVRCREAILDQASWVYVVLTFAQSDWPDKWKLYRAGVGMWSKLRKRFAREFGRVKYIQTWERHAKGGAHVNVLLHAPRLTDRVETDWKKFRRGWLEPAAVACGFGMRTWVEVMRGEGPAMAGYLTKLSRELVGAGSKSQIPYDAPPHFRRLRASQHTLPPVIKSDWTGIIRFCNISRFPEFSKNRRRNRPLTGQDVENDPNECVTPAGR